MKKINRTLMFSLTVVLLIAGTSLSAYPQETVLDLITEAYENGEIDYETALVNKYFAIFKPDRVQAQFQTGIAPVVECPTWLLVEIRKNWDLLSDDTKALLAPAYYRPPNSSSDYYWGASGLTFKESVVTSTHFKVHYLDESDPENASNPSRTSSTYANNILSYAEFSWTKEISNLGYLEPPKDADYSAKYGADADLWGGDNKYDIYIYNGTWSGLTLPEVSTTSNDYWTTSFLIDLNAYDGGRPTTAHEFFHAIQLGRYDAFEDDWWKEASASWMQDEVYPTYNSVTLGRVADFFEAPELSLDLFNGGHQYDAVIWPIYLEQRYGVGFLKNIWEECAPWHNPAGAGGNSLPATNIELGEQGTNLRDAFLDFATKNCNKDWYNDGSKYPKVKIAASHTLSPFNRKVDEQTVYIDHLASNYVKFSPGWTLIRAQTLQIKVKGLDDENLGTRVVVKPFLGAPYELNLTVDPGETEGHVEIDNFGLFRISEVILVLANGSQDDDNLEFKYEAALAKPIIFVIDDTGSMWNEIASVRNTLIAKINELEATGELIRYTLITYKDYVTLDGQTADPDVIRGWVSGLYASGGGDCPEEGYGALELATTVAAGGELWWMTDADSHGGWPRILNVVFRLTAAGVRVHSVIMGSCSWLACNEHGTSHSSSSNEPDQAPGFFGALDINAYKAAAYISGATGGLYFGVSSAQVPDAVTIILEEMTGDATLAIFNQTDSDTFTVPVDSTVSEVRFSLNSFPGSSLSLRVITPGGVEIASGDPGVTYLSAGGSKYYMVTAPALETGEWIAEITGSGAYVFSSSGITPITCDYLSQTSVGLGGPFTLRVSFQGDVENLGFQMVKDNGDPFEELSIFDDGAHDDLDVGDGIYANTYTPTALGTYRVKASGNSFVCRQDPEKIVVGTVNVMAPSDVVLHPGDSITHVFTIENIGGTDQTFTLTGTSSEGWADLSGVPSQATIPAGSATTVPIPLVVPITAPRGSFDQLTLLAVSQADPLINDVDAVVTYVWTGPVITALNPSSAPPGASVEIVGENFGEDPGVGNRSTDENNVTLNGERLADPNILIWSDTLITFIVPPSATSGPIVVTAGGENSNEFMFVVEVRRAEICNSFLTPNTLNVGRNAEHTFMIHLDPCESMGVSRGDSAEVYVDVDTSCSFEDDERYSAVVNCPSMVVKVYCPDLVDNDPRVVIYSVNNIPISDTLGNDLVLRLDTFTPGGGNPKPLATSSPVQFTLSQNYPNPFNPICEIRYGLPTDCQVTIIIYNILGQKVRVLVDEHQDAGHKSVRWDGKDDQDQEVTSGVYFYRLRAGKFVQSKKMVLLR